jgi:CRP/FNR family transcriptional regulator
MAIPLECDACAPAAEFVQDFPFALVRTLRDEILFAPGQRKQHLYLIEAGIIGQYRKRIGRAPELIEFAFTGDVVGFGYHENHTCGAQAVGEARVRCLPLTALDAVLKNNKRALDRYAEALEREFNFRREELTSAPRTPTARVAALLLAISELHAREGGDPSIVTDAISCVAVANWLGVEVALLANALIELDRVRLIERASHGGLRLLDRAGLARVASAGGRSVGAGDEALSLQL